MCYKTSLDKKLDQITNRMERDFAFPSEYKPSGHIDAFLQPNLYIIPQDASTKIYPAVWGLVPDFINSSSSNMTPNDYVNRYKTFNARGEEFFDKRTYKASAENQRCLILADGFYEPHHYKGKAQPFFCILEGKKLFAFAGLYTKLDHELYTTTIVTVDANDTFQKIHNQKKRMPLVLNENMHNDWISDLNSNQVNEIVKTGFTNEVFNYHAVTNEIYKNRKLVGSLAQKPVQARDPQFNQASLF